MSHWLSLVVDLPHRLPRDTQVGGLLPTPIQAGCRDVVEDHTLHNGFLSCRYRSLKDHLAITKSSGEIQVRASIVYPGLLPPVEGWIIDGEAQSLERVRWVGIEGLENHLTVQYC